jgi:hypothetical protein
LNCPIHRGESKTLVGEVVGIKHYNPAFNRKVYGQPVTWFNQIRVKDEADSVRKILYDFQLRGQPSTRTNFTNGFPKVGQIIACSYYALGPKELKGCMKTCVVL